jgi:hypothetical protein
MEKNGRGGSIRVHNDQAYAELRERLKFDYWPIVYNTSVLLTLEPKVALRYISISPRSQAIRCTSILQVPSHFANNKEKPNHIIISHPDREVSDCEPPPPSRIPCTRSFASPLFLSPPSLSRCPPLALPLWCVSQLGNTALIEASFKGHTAIAKLLVDAKANTDLQNKVTLAEERAESQSKSLMSPLLTRQNCGRRGEDLQEMRCQVVHLLSELSGCRGSKNLGVCSGGRG